MLGWFRRHAKVLMVVLGSAAMAIFGLGPVFDTLSRGGGGGRSSRDANPVIATWSGGEITRLDLNRVQTGHFQTQRFLNALVQAAAAKNDGEVRSMALPIAPIQDGKRAFIDEQLIARILMAERAKKEGIVVSDGAVDDYFVMASGDAGFSARELEAINSEVNQRTTLEDIRAHMKIELLANQMQRYSLAGIPMVPNPTESMELFGRSMDQIECEVYPIKVEDYIDQVSGEPTASELKKLYEEGKYEYADPISKKPGFKIGRRANVQYVKADYDTYLQNEMNKITDEEVQKEYDRLVAEKNSLVLEPLAPDDNAIQLDVSPPTEGEGAETPGDVDAPPAENSDVDAPPTATEGMNPETSPVEGSAPVEGSTPTETTPVEGSAPVEKTGSGNKEGDQSYLVSPTKFQFVSTRQEAQQGTPVTGTPVTGTPTTGTPVTGVPTQGTPTTGAPVTGVPMQGTPVTGTPVTGGQVTGTPTTGTPTTGTPVTGTPATETPAATLTKPATQESGAMEVPVETKKPDPPQEMTGENTTPAQTTPAQTTPAQTGDASADEAGGLDAETLQSIPDEEPEVERKIKPLDEKLAEQIKRSLAIVPTRDAMRDAISNAEDHVADQFDLALNAEDEYGEMSEEIPEFDFAKVGKEYNLDSGETGLVDEIELEKETIGKVQAFKQMMVRGRAVPQLVPVGQLVFDNLDDARFYEAQTEMDWSSNSIYLYWIAEKAETEVPSFNDCKPAIEKFWKQKKAYELALADAEKIKDEINQKRKKMSEVKNGERVFSTGAFTWFSSVGRTIYSNPLNVDSAGEDFMSTAFSLEELQAGVAPNANNDTIYIVQALGEPRTAEETGRDYLENQFFRYKRIPTEVLRASQVYGQQLNLTWNEELQETMDLKYIDR